MILRILNFVIAFLFLNIIENVKVIRFIRGCVDYVLQLEKWNVWNNRSLIDYDTYEITSSCRYITTWYNIYGDCSEFNLGRGEIAIRG